MNNSLQTDRSRIITSLRCPRERYWTYEFNGTGLAPIKKRLPLVFGSAFHEAAEVFLRDSDISNRPNAAELWGTDLAEAAVTRSTEYLYTEFGKTAVDFDEPQTLYHAKEQIAIAEALVRGWSATRRERFLESFEVLEVEQEGRALLTTHAPHVELLFRPDALVREKATGDLYVISWKTSSTFGPWVTEKCAVDMQSMSEVYGIERIGALKMDLGAFTEVVVPAKVEGVLYLFAVKGQRRFDDYLGFKTQSTPLAYAWHRPGPTPEEDEWSWAYEYETEEFNDKTGKMKRTKLGKGWRKVAVWEHYPGGIAQWVEDTVNQRIAPRHVNMWDSIFPEMLPISRRASDVESWRRQAIARELRIEQSAREVANAQRAGENRFAEALDREFPQNTHSCFSFGGKCSVFDICWTESVKQDPMASGLYQIRIPNHPEKGDDE